MPMFFGDSGSIDGGDEREHVQLEVGLDVVGQREDRGVVCLDLGPHEPPHVGVRGGEVDVAAPDPLARPRRGAGARIAAGCGSWMTTKSYSPSHASTIRSVARSNVSRAAWSSVTSAPWRPLWIRFVTSKKASSPGMIRHSASRPASRISAVRVGRISATPPPNFVALTWRTRAPCEVGREGADLGHGIVPGDRGIGVKRQWRDGDLLEHPTSPVPSAGLGLRRRLDAETILTPDRDRGCIR